MTQLSPIAVTDREDSMRLLYLVLDDANHTFGPPIPKGIDTRFRSVFLGFSMLLLIGMLFGIAIGLTRTLEPVQETTRKQLQDRIAVAQTTLSDTQTKLDNLNLQLTEQRSNLSNQSRQIQQINSNINSLNAIAGYAAIRGDGVKVLIQPSIKPSLEDGVDLGVVLDSDIARIVNGVLSNGAIAVSINNYRLTSATAIRSAGKAILVGYQPLSPPYEVVAIGNTERMLDELSVGKTGKDIKEIARNYGLRFKVSEVQQISISESNSPIRNKVAVRIIE